jgi:seryl-tRNA synthetase
MPQSRPLSKRELDPMNMAVKSIVAEAASPFDAVEQELLESMGVDGVFARTGAYERVIEGLGRFISQLREPDMEVFRFPPVMSRSQLEKSGYLNSFPHLLGCVHCLQGSEAQIRTAVEVFEAGGDWTSSNSAADVVLSPAACYPIYPIAARRGPVPGDGLRFDVACDCFRREPSRDLDRLQSFRMREFVCIGTPQQIEEFRHRWMERAPKIAGDLGLPWRIDHASDPFFGRTGQLLALSQVDASLKFELLIPLRKNGKPTACMSFNCHKDHFGEAWGLRTKNGELAHTGCTAFGIDRLAVALFVTHGTDTNKWLGDLRSRLSL